MDEYRLKRLAIFVMYDKEGIVDDYITFLLRSLKVFFSELIIVCNGNVLDTERYKLEQFAGQIIIRENNGFDIMAWRSVILEYLDRDKMKFYDELIILNDSFYGPVFSFHDMFQKMDSKNIDFWGITRHPKSYDTVRGCIPEHIQSFFMVIRNRMFMSAEFHEFWQKLDLSDKGLLDAILEFELTFTSHFSQIGYNWDTYTETKCLDSVTDNALNFNPYYLTPLELVKDYKCPIIKKKALVDSNLQAVAGEEPERLLNFLQNNTGYDTKLIWDNLIRIMPKDKLYAAFHMNYVLSDNGDTPSFAQNKVALYIKGDIYKIKESIIKKNTNIKILELKEEAEESIIFNGICEYDYVGLLSVNSVQDGSILDTIYRRSDLLDNMLKNEAYLANIIQAFENNEKLGILYPLIRNKRMESKNKNLYMESFWCRREYLKNPEKYLYGTVCTREYASLKLSQYKEQICRMQSVDKLPDIFNKEDVISKPEFMGYIDKKERFYVFGTGVYGRRIMQELKEKGKKIEAFIVSDGQPKVKVNDVEVLNFSEYLSTGNKEYGLIVALSKKVQHEVIDIIRDSGLTNVYYL